MLAKGEAGSVWEQNQVLMKAGFLHADLLRQQLGSLAAGQFLSTNRARWQRVLTASVLSGCKTR